MKYIYWNGKLKKYDDSLEKDLEQTRQNLLYALGALIWLLLMFILFTS